MEGPKTDAPGKSLTRVNVDVLPENLVAGHIGSVPGEGQPQLLKVRRITLLIPLRLHQSVQNCAVEPFRPRQVENGDQRVFLRKTQRKITIHDASKRSL